MYNLTVNIESRDLDYLKEVQSALTDAFQVHDKVDNFSFNHIEVEERRGGARHSRGVTAPPPASIISNGLTDLQAKAFAELLKSESMAMEAKQQLMEYMGDWEEYKDKRNGDFIEEEEMKL